MLPKLPQDARRLLELIACVRTFGVFENSLNSARNDVRNILAISGRKDFVIELSLKLGVGGELRAPKGEGRATPRGGLLEKFCEKILSSSIPFGVLPNFCIDGYVEYFLGSGQHLNPLKANSRFAANGTESQ